MLWFTVQYTWSTLCNTIVTDSGSTRCDPERVITERLRGTQTITQRPEAERQMTKSMIRGFPLTVDINLDDEDSVEWTASLLGVSPDMVKRVLRFCQTIMVNAEDQELTTGQLLTALVSVMTLLVQDCGDQDEQSDMCMRLFEGLRDSVGLPTHATHVSAEQVH